MAKNDFIAKKIFNRCEKVANKCIALALCKKKNDRSDTYIDCMKDWEDRFNFHVYDSVKISNHPPRF